MIYDGKKLLDIQTAAELMGVSPFTIRAWIRQRRLAFHRLGRRVLFRPEDIESFLAQGRVPAREEKRER